VQEKVYRKLAQQLDAIPNGFPPTASGADLRFLAKLFTEQEAALAATMRQEPEPASEIAARAGIAPDAALEMLEAMATRGLIRSQRRDEQAVFALRPFVVGFYEAQLPRMDKEMALLFEQYLQDSRGGPLRDVPALHRIIPVGEAIPAELEIFSYEHATELVKGAKSWAVRDCICRVQQQLVGKGCDHSIENCLSFAPVEGAFDNSTASRTITKEEALRILREAQESGLVHSAGNYRTGNHYICNCCTCCCGILRGVAEFAIPTAVARSDFRAVVDVDRCIGCGECIDRCQFEALSVPKDVSTVDYARCVGCGLCVTVCPVEAMHLERRPAGAVPLPPANEDEWRTQRTESRVVPSPDLP
jgi:ferredoxin